jgi:hypothetical protein
MALSYLSDLTDLSPFLSLLEVVSPLSSLSLLSISLGMPPSKNFGVPIAFSLELSNGRGRIREHTCLGRIAVKKSHGNLDRLNLASGFRWGISFYWWLGCPCQDESSSRSSTTSMWKSGLLMANPSYKVNFIVLPINHTPDESCLTYTRI